ncbi:post-GPI attachment to proteins factor 6 isoform X2 [Linepithema humile]|nr:PREDICTED: transmembrane protein 8A-like isoform X2 [Linepithema humile]XP_012226361.1 PREDICTED: transmembrane protein 8A-like isoform X2 [Linepithema humile]XP_012226362.1 PREDICTED: transmembrane protein 8A-like isoform X2 [Linepithema humile]
MRKSALAVLLAWTLAAQQGLCGKLEKIAQQPSNTLVDYSAYRHVSIIHFNVPERVVVVVFKFTAKEEKTGGIGKCPPRNVSLYLKSGSLPFVRPDGSKVAAKLMEMSRRRQYHNLEMHSDGDQYMIKIEAPAPGDWYAIAFRSWTDPDKEKIKQQGLSASCETMLDAEMLVETPTTTSLIDSEFEYEVQLNETSDTAVVQYFVPDVGLEKLNLSLKLSCDDCDIAIYITAEDNLVDDVINSTMTSLSFRPYAGVFHYVTLRLLSGNTSNVTMRLPTSREHRTDAVNQVTPVVLLRKSFPEFFLFDYEHLHGNDTKPQPFNVTADTLSVLSFEIGRVYDVGGTITLGFKLVDVEEKYKKDIILVACVSLGYYTNITSGGACIRAQEITTADVYVNATEPAYVHIPFPEPGIWYISLRVFCAEDETTGKSNASLSNACPCGRACLRGNATCEAACDCLPRCAVVRVESIVSSSPCIEGRCGGHGKCMHYMSGGFVFSACHCTGGYRGFDCADATYVLSSSGILLQLLALTFSNLAFFGSVYVAIRREYFTEAVAYAAVMFFSTFYHACEAGENVYGVCIMRLNVLQFCDFFNALLAIWVTLVAMASFGPRLTAFCQITGAIILAVGAEMDRTALWVFLLPAVTGSALIGLSWGLKCRRKRTVRYPLRPYRTIYFPAGFILVALGLICYAFLQTRRNYYLVHSLWHVCVAIGVILLLPKRQYMK